MSGVVLRADERQVVTLARGLGWIVERRAPTGHLVLRHSAGQLTRIPRKLRGELLRSVLARLRRDSGA
jgi:hypothetical protein